jgi:hypothetical protein
MDQQDQGLMTFFEAEAHSFVLRIWRENRHKPDVPAEWRGWIDHVQSGNRTYFRDLDEIGRIVAGHIQEAADPADQVFMPLPPKDYHE